MSESSSERPSPPPWRILLCVLLGSLLFALFFVTPALFHAPQIVMEDWRKVLLGIALLQVVLMGGGLLLILSVFCRQWSSLWKSLIASLLVGGMAAFYPAIQQLIQGEEIVRGELGAVVVKNGEESIVIDPNSKQTRFLKKRGKASIAIVAGDGEEKEFQISHGDAARIEKIADPGDDVELKLLPVLKRLLDVKKVN